ncbi:hypothetical protein BZA77DRAFT_45160 [Pyronema omphalodes]|nr:hypothetical protein BZA77DRAFT_45160 [Pyronema omphalodes]
MASAANSTAMDVDVTTPASFATAPSKAASAEPADSVLPDADSDDADLSDSEYETDPDAEPDVFYVTLDLTVPQPALAGPSTNPHHTQHPLPLKKSTQILGASRHQRHKPVPAWARPSSFRKDRLQILDLASEQPLFSYQNKIYAGQWTKTVGSEVFISGGNRDGEEEEDKEGMEYKEVPRISGGGYYYSEKDGSLASAFTGGRRRNNGHMKKPDRDGDMMIMLDTSEGQLIGVGRDRVHCTPAAVKAKEWPFREQLAGKSDFLRRLEEVQIQRGEIGSEEVEEEMEGEETGEEEARAEEEVGEGYFRRGWKEGDPVGNTDDQARMDSEGAMGTSESVTAPIHPQSSAKDIEGDVEMSENQLDVPRPSNVSLSDQKNEATQIVTGLIAAEVAAHNSEKGVEENDADKRVD